jgi:hypothetical protein
MIKLISGALLILTLVLALPGVSLAGNSICPNPPCDPGIYNQYTTGSGVLTVFERVIGWIFTLLLVLAVIFILYAAFKYLTAAGVPANIQTANKMLLYAAIAVAVAVLARTIPVLVRNFVGSGAGGGSAPSVPPPPGGGGTISV